MCTPDQLDELVVGWLHGEGYIETMADLLEMRPCAKEPGFWVRVPEERFPPWRRRAAGVLASGLRGGHHVPGDPLSSLPRRAAPPESPVEQMRLLFKELFARGVRYGRPAACTRPRSPMVRGSSRHAEDIGRHNAVDKVIGTIILDGRAPRDSILLVTGRISGELAFKARPRAHSAGRHAVGAILHRGRDRRRTG